VSPAGDARPRLHRVADVALTVAAVLGTLAIVGALGAHLLGVRVVLFASGSMSPAIDAGAAALTVPVAAAEIRAGQVVTVGRPGQLPITHRVVSASGTGPERELVLRGDANAADDPEPYRVRSAHHVVAVVPRVAPVLGWFAEPGTLAATTALATGLVLWAFWPRREEEGAGPGGAGPEGTPDGAPPGPGAAEPSRVRSLAVAAALVLAVPVPAVAPASAGADEVVTTGRVLTLTSLDDPAMRALAPGAAADWVVGLRAAAPEPGQVAVTADADGADTPLLVAVDSCTERWAASGCPGRLRQVLPAGPAAALTGQVLETVTSDEVRWFRFRVSVPESAPATAWSTTLTVTATGAGDTVSTAPGGGSGSLASTGAPAGTDAFSLLAAGLLVSGGLLLLLDRRRAAHRATRGTEAPARRYG
jgi:signal peptidase